MKEYYAINFLVNQKPHYCIWYTNEEDKFIIEGKKLKWFNTKLEMKSYCTMKGIKLDKSITEYNVEQVISWNEQTKEHIKSENVLDFWNIFDDLSKSLGYEYYGSRDSLNSIYEKLVFGSNLPSLNLSKQVYQAEFSEKEIREIEKTIKQGVAILKFAISK